ncbi:MAG TPA: hypothetical protein VMU93_14245 [Caulobacteraceae bacterium]|nr:hypothetical protein [Caulobacteraceae bacterium]
MATTTVSDYVIWTRHVHGDAELVSRILAMWAGQTLQLEVDGVSGTWRKMDDGADGRPTPGLRPLGAAQGHWRGLFKTRRGDIVSLRAAQPHGGVSESSLQERRARLVAPPRGRTQEERDAAFRNFLELARQGYRSDGPYGSRDELHDRE